ncbi:MAG: nitroreductase family protein [Planctomycetota bacterium]|nr:nitroreductase family protein [Planctomycetota bacterium]
MSEKPAATSYPVHELIRRRWSPRAFAERPVEREKIGSLLEAARWAASSRNEQPWRFLVAARGSPARERLWETLADGNKPWAAGAPLLILVCANLQSGDGSPNRLAQYDCGQAVAALTLQALELDLWVHQMAGFSVERARNTFAVPAPFEPLCVLAVGYYGDPSQLPDQRRQQEAGPRSRKPLDQLAFDGAWDAGFR